MGAGSIGVDYYEHSVASCNQSGFETYTPNAFLNRYPVGSLQFDSILIAHLFEHLTTEQDLGILHDDTPYLKCGGQVDIINPQEVGHASDASKVACMSFSKVGGRIKKAWLSTGKYYRFPFPPFVGRMFKYNEFVFVANRA